jgi:hypothetical protein
MNRYIEDSTGLTYQDLQNDDWDVIKLNITVDTDSIMDWVNSVESDNQDSIWNFELVNLVDEPLREKFLTIQKNLLVRTATTQPEQWGLQWSFQREGVIPFIVYACKKQFPEVYEEGFHQNCNQNLEKYVFGFWKRYYELLGPDVFQITRLVKFPKGCGLNAHRDTNKGQLIRMHTIPQIGTDHYFDYMSDPGRQYKLEPGCTYLLNTGMTHSAVNNDNQDWWMLHNNPADNAITKLCNLKVHVQ